MQQTLKRLNPFRISTNKRYHSFDATARGVSFHIRGVVYDQYKRIDLKKSSNKLRINHRSTVTGETYRQTNERKKQSNTCGQRWQKTLDRYIEAKERIQIKRITYSNKFEFMKLDKMNHNRKMRLLKEGAIPLNIINSSALCKSINMELHPQQDARSHNSSFKGHTEHSRTKRDVSLRHTSDNNEQAVQKAIISMDTHVKGKTQQPLSQIMGKFSSRQSLIPEHRIKKTHKFKNMVINNRMVRTITE